MQSQQPQAIKLLGKRCFSVLLHHSFTAPNHQTDQQFEMEQLDAQHAPEDRYAFYKKVGSPKYFVAPMVDQSELPYRMLTRKYGADICYTPMYHARLFSESAAYRKNMFTPCKEDRPLVVQFCANDPDVLLRAAQYVEDHCDAVDINLGCPQGIARKGNYGSFLLEKTEVILSMVRKLKANLKVPVTCKIRCLPKEEDTLALALKIQEAGASLLTVHGRTREHNKQTVGPANWQIIKKIKESLDIPVVLNGGISDHDDVQTALQETGVDGVMSSESILEYPALFDNTRVYDIDQIALEYLELYQKYPGEGNLKIVKAHLHKFMHSGFNIHGHVDLRERLNQIGGKPEEFGQFRELVLEMQRRRQGIEPIDKITWYYRHWREHGQPASEGVKNKGLLPESKILDREWDSWMCDDPRNPQSQKIKDAKQVEKQKQSEIKAQAKLLKKQQMNEQQNPVEEKKAAPAKMTTAHILKNI